ncbi:MAG: RraA family protein [Chthoniobacteraceae bacterium]
MNHIVGADTLEALRSLDTCDVANAIESFDLRLRSEGYTDPTLHCRTPQLPPMVGYAVTMRIRSSSVPMMGHDYIDRTDWWKQIDSFLLPHVMVIQDMDAHPGRGAYVGEVHANILKALGFVGVVTNGAVRDLPIVEKIGFNLFSEHVSVSHGYAHIVNFGAPVEVAGLKIKAGDLLHGDQHGIVRIPLEVAADLPRISAAVRKREKIITTFCRSNDFSVAGLVQVIRHSASLVGTEPGQPLH